MINWKTLAQLGMLAGSVALLSACGASTWWCDNCDGEEEDVVYIEVDKKSGNRVVIEERMEKANDDFKR